MPQKYPPLKLREILQILKNIGFIEVSISSSGTSHQKWRQIRNGVEYNVVVDLSYEEFYDDTLKSMISQSGVNREEFYGAAKKTFKKIENTIKKNKAIEAS